MLTVSDSVSFILYKLDIAVFQLQNITIGGGGSHNLKTAYTRMIKLIHFFYLHRCEKMFPNCCFLCRVGLRTVKHPVVGFNKIKNSSYFLNLTVQK